MLEEYRNDVTCRCRTFGHNDGVDDFKVKYDDWVNVDSEKGTKIEKDFVEVRYYNCNSFLPLQYLVSKRQTKA